jgi:hypothetical protein
MKRRYPAICAGIFGLVSLLLIFGLVSCGNILNPPPQAPAALGSLRISLGSASASQRTLMPKAEDIPEPQAYKVILSGPGKTPIINAVSPNAFTAGYAIDNLTAGTWTVIVFAFKSAGDCSDSDISNDKAFAQGNSSPLSLVNGASLHAVIELKPIMADWEDHGTFSYTIDNTGGWASGYDIAIEDLHKRPVNANLGTAFSGGASLPPGQYIMHLKIDSTSGGSDGITEILHIYSNLETRADYTAGDFDFSGKETTALSGAVSYKVNDVGQNNYAVVVSPSNPPTTLHFKSDAISGSLYSVQIPRPVENTTFFFFIEDGQNPGLYIPAGSKQIANTAADTYDIMSNITPKTTSGTASGLGTSPNNRGWKVFAYASDDISLSPVGISDIDSNDGSWTMQIPDAFSTLYFTIGVTIDYYNNQYEVTCQSDLAGTGTAGNTAIDLTMPDTTPDTTGNEKTIGKSDWGHLFKLTPEFSGSYTLDAIRTDNSFDPFMYLYSCTSADEIVSDDDSGGHPNSRIAHTLNANECYYVLVRGIAGMKGRFTFNITEPIAVNFSGLSADGLANITTTAKLTLVFDQDIPGLSRDDISLSGADYIYKGALKHIETGVYELPISGFSVGGDLTVTISKPGCAVAPASRTVTIHHHATVPLTGTVSGLGTSPENGGWIIYAYTPDDFGLSPVATATVDAQGSWTMRIPEDATGMLYFSIGVTINHIGTGKDITFQSDLAGTGSVDSESIALELPVVSEASNQRTIGSSDWGHLFKIMPFLNGLYTLDAIKQQGGFDPFMYLYNSDNADLFDSDDDDGEDNNARIVRSLAGGQSYYVLVCAYKGTRGSFTFNIIGR